MKKMRNKRISRDLNQEKSVNNKNYKKWSINLVIYRLNEYYHKKVNILKLWNTIQFNLK